MPEVIRNTVNVTVTKAQPTNVTVGARERTTSGARRETATVEPKENEVNVTLNATPSPLATYNSAEADVPIKSGQGVYIKNNGHLALAQADNSVTSKIAGLAFDNAGVTFACRYITDGELSKDDWTEVIGAEQLTIGAVYYLDPNNAGRLTTIAPSATGQYVVRVGVALTVKKIDIEIQQSILL